MPRISPKIRHERREAILQAAVDCLALHGYRGTSMRAIAQSVGLTKGGLYPYFENKDAILLAVADRYLANVVERLAPHPGVTAAQQLAGYLDDFEATFHDPRTESVRRAVLDLWLSAGENPAVRESIERRYHSVLNGLSEVVRRGQAEGIFREDVPAEQVAGLVLAARDGMLFQTEKLKVQVPIAAVKDLLKDLLLDAISTAHPHAPASLLAAPFAGAAGD